MKNHCSFSDIGQYRNTVKTIQDRTRYVGKDADGNAIYDNTKPMPLLRFVGTVKLHGTNAGISLSKDGNYWAQSRENIITPMKDNAGFAFFTEAKKSAFMKLFDKLPFGGYDTITIFGEWCGQGIQKGVAISQLPKMFVIFDIKRSYDTPEKGTNSYATEDEIRLLRDPDNQIFNIYDYARYEIDIDFAHPELAQNKMIEITQQVEQQCPVGKAFGVEGVGEGVVWTHLDSDGNKYRWKVKGEKHSSSKVKMLATVDTEKLESIAEFVEYAVTESRLNQAVEKVYGIGGYIDITKMGDFIRWIVNDIQKEEIDTMDSNGLTPKDVNGQISKVCKNWLLQKINSTF